MMNSLPEKWFVLYSTREEFDKINKHYDKLWEYDNQPNRGYHNGNFDNNWISGVPVIKRLIQIGFIQISFDDFARLVLNQDNQNNNEDILFDVL